MKPNQHQYEAWNGPESLHYVDQADRYDLQLAPVSDALLARARIHADDAVLDVGCGCGSTTLAAAQRARRSVGVDISGPLIGVAAGRARHAGVANAEFVVADAQTHEFTEVFDVIISQFGLMFFDDPVTAFANLRRTLADNGRIVFTTWQRLSANEWLAPVVRAVGRYSEVPELGGLSSGGGMFALRDEGEIASLLAAAGFGAVEIDPLAPTLVIGGGGRLDDCTDFLLGMGIVRGLLGRLEPRQRDLAARSVRADLQERYEVGVGVRLGASVWLVSGER